MPLCFLKELTPDNWWLNPADLQKEYLGACEATQWDYADGDMDVGLMGAPVLKNTWIE